MSKKTHLEEEMKTAKQAASNEFVGNHKHRDIKELRGQIKLRDDYNYKKLRQDLEE
jgi:hypothetical protein